MKILYDCDEGLQKSIGHLMSTCINLDVSLDRYMNVIILCIGCTTASM